MNILLTKRFFEMRKQLVFCTALTSLLMLGSCSQSEEVVSDATKAPIAFNSYLSSATRASIKTIDTLKGADQGFGVIAIKHAGEWDAITDNTQKVPNFMYNQTVLWDEANGAYTYSPVKYWPLDAESVSFFAYSPRVTSENASLFSVSDVAAAGNPTVTYTVPADAQEQIDFVTAKSLDRTQDKTYGATGFDGQGAVYFDFMHRLSKIAFSARLTEDYQEGVTLTVTSLKFYCTDASIINKGTFDLSAQTWTLDGTSTFPIQTADAVNSLSATDCVVTSATDLTMLNTADNYLMLLPQAYGEGSMSIAIDYKMTYKDPADPAAVEQEITSVTGEVFPLPQIKDAEGNNVGWKQGKSYTYSLVLGLHSINIDTDTNVDDWGDGGSTDVNF